MAPPFDAFSQFNAPGKTHTRTTGLRKKKNSAAADTLAAQIASPSNPSNNASPPRPPSRLRAAVPGGCSH